MDEDRFYQLITKYREQIGDITRFNRPELMFLLLANT